MERRILPAKAHVIAGQLEDALTVWRSRPDSYHQRYVDAADEATAMCGEMVAVFSALRDELTGEVGRYRDSRLGMAPLADRAVAPQGSARSAVSVDVDLLYDPVQTAPVVVNRNGATEVDVVFGPTPPTAHRHDELTMLLWSMVAPEACGPRRGA